MNVLIIGNGGREHAFAWKISQSKILNKLYISPGNPGTAAYGENIQLQITDHKQIAIFCKLNDIDLLLIGPEAPLVDGLVNALQQLLPSLMVIGPNAKGALLEGSKSFAKKFMQRHQIPTASYIEVNMYNLTEGHAFIECQKPPYVLKADGLAAGKGVLIIEDINEAKKQLSEMLSGKFGDASKKVVIESFLSGIEFSVFVLTDGKNYVLLPEAKDYKRIGENDTGLNTGGMGAISPVPFCDAILLEKVKNNIIDPTIKGLSTDNIDYVGFIFFGLINVEGEPFVIEYNCRMGDPETEAVLPRINADLLPYLVSAAKKELTTCKIPVIEDTAGTIIMVSGGYPETYQSNFKIEGIDRVQESLIFHSGTKIIEGDLVTNGGRVLAITTLDKNPIIAVKKSISTAEQINFENKYFRKDIGFDILDL